jgi:hypothetical protein
MMSTIRPFEANIKTDLELGRHVLCTLETVDGIAHELDQDITRKVLGVDVDALRLVERIERARGLE